MFFLYTTVKKLNTAFQGIFLLFEVKKKMPFSSDRFKKILQNIIPSSGRIGESVECDTKKAFFSKLIITEHSLYYSMFLHSIYQLLLYSKPFPIFF